MEEGREGSEGGREGSEGGRDRREGGRDRREGGRDRREGSEGGREGGRDRREGREEKDAVTSYKLKVQVDLRMQITAQEYLSREDMSLVLHSIKTTSFTAVC